jgi:hypothetical protein
MTLEYLAAGRVNVSEPHGENGRAGVAETARTGLLRTLWVRRQFPQFPHTVSRSPITAIGPIQRNATRYCASAGGGDREFFRTAIGARKGVPPLRPFPPVIWRPWTSQPQAKRVVQAADDERAAPPEASMSMNIMPILSRRRSAGIRHNIAQFCQALLFPPPGGKDGRDKLFIQTNSLVSPASSAENGAGNGL